jgi:2,3-bisphosphoglycerate-dependent phosphoglycerate mutase
VPALLLVRHCESSGPGPEAPLTARGCEQARALALRLAPHPVDAIVSSPYPKARETIAPFAARSGLAVRLDGRLAERRLSAEPIASWREVVRESFVDLDHCAPGGESGREVLARGRAVLEDVLSAGHRLPLLVSHGQWIALLLHSIDPGFGYAGWESLSFPDVIRLRADSGGALAFERVRE